MVDCFGHEGEGVMKGSGKVPTPGFRVAVKVHHGNDQNFTLLDCVNDSKGKAVCAATANLFVQREPCLRMHENAADAARASCRKSNPRPGTRSS